MNLPDLDLNLINESINLANRAFSNQLSSRNPNAQSVNFHFKLARFDVYGNPMDIPGVIIQEGFSAATELAELQKYKKLHQWNPDKYINVWVSDIHPNAWSNFARVDCDHPLAGLDCLDESKCHVMSAVNIQRKHLGKRSDTFVHELENFFGLFHIFTWPCSRDNDFCEDTPKYVNSAHRVGPPITCDGIKFLQDNYMDYADGRSYTFTCEQTERMRHVLNYGRYAGNRRGLCYQ